jgi:hypothetical protein
MADRRVNFGFCGSSVRCLLITANVCFLLLGIVAITTGTVAKINIKELNDFDEIKAVRPMANSLLVIGAFALFVSLFGIIGAKYLNRFFLIFYLIAVLCMFLLHGVALIWLVSNTNSIHDGYISAVNSTVNDLKQHSNSTKYQEECKFMLALSNFCECCGFNGASDFSRDVAMECCAKPSDQKDGCAQKSYDQLKSVSFNLIIVPSLVILAIELFAILVVPFLIGKRGSDYESI